MTYSPPAHAPAQSSRLASTLSALGIVADPVSHSEFVRKLAELFDLSDSITLSAALKRPAAKQADADTAAPATTRDEFLALREQLVCLIASGFDPATDDLSLRLPRPNAETLADQNAGFKPYQRYYALLQSELDYRILRFRHRLRQALSQGSERLAHLAALDAALDSTLSAHSRKLLATVPRLLQTRFQAASEQARQSLQDQGVSCDPANWLLPGAWLHGFCVDMQALILAELELRLQPVLGLIEALDEEPDHNI